LIDLVALPNLCFDLFPTSFKIVFKD